MAEEAELEELLVETECTLADVMTYGAGEFEHSGRSRPEGSGLGSSLGERPDLIARALETLARVELFRGRLEESAAYAEEGAELSRELAERSPRRLLPSMPTAMGLMASWKVGNKAMEIQCLMYLAYVRVFQGRLKRGSRSDVRCLASPASCPSGPRRWAHRRFHSGSWRVASTRKRSRSACEGPSWLIAQDMFLLWHNLDHLGRTRGVIGPAGGA